MGKNLALPNAIFTDPVEEKLAFPAAFADGGDIHAVPKTYLKASEWGLQIGTAGLRRSHAFWRERDSTETLSEQIGEIKAKILHLLLTTSLEKINRQVSCRNLSIFVVSCVDKRDAATQPLRRKLLLLDVEQIVTRLH